MKRNTAMKRRLEGKLTLNRETILHLEERQLKGAAMGGSGHTTITATRGSIYPNCNCTDYETSCGSCPEAN
jgi:hypothetical protein